MPSPSDTAVLSPSASATPAQSMSVYHSSTVSPSDVDGRSFDNDDDDGSDDGSSNMWMWVAAGVVIFAVAAIGVMFMLKYKKMKLHP